MPQILPSNVYAQPVPGKGTGLFTSQTIPAGELVFAIERPLVQVPDNKHLAKACYNCFYLEPPEGRSAVEARTLKACNGCKTVKYCSKIMINSMTVATASFDTIGSCVSTTAALLNHSCNPNCIYQFSEGSLTVRSLQAIPEGGELTICYVDPRSTTVERQKELQAKWFFTCTCKYCAKRLTCGQPDLPPSLSSKMSAVSLSQLENEGRRLQDEASAAPADAVEILSRAMALFTRHKEIYPLWRYPWMSIRRDLKDAQIGQGNWASAVGHALKIYLYIDPVLFPEAWIPHRAVETYGLLKVMLEILHELTKPQRNEQLIHDLWEYKIDFPTVIRHLSDEVERASNKGFGPRSPIATDLELYEKEGIDFGNSDWQTELTKLKRAADQMVD
ncbi:MAG: hypothetical protein Q9197_000666 [Variospora fuerteventurae]